MTAPKEASEAVVDDRPFWQKARWRRIAAYVCMGIAGLIAISVVGGRADSANGSADKAVSASAEAKQTAADVKRLLDEFKTQVAAQDIAACKTTNSTRQNIRQTFSDIINISISSQPTSDLTEEEQKQLDDFLTQFNAVLEQRLPLVDCNSDGAVNEEDGVMKEVQSG